VSKSHRAAVDSSQHHLVIGHVSLALAVTANVGAMDRRDGAVGRLDCGDHAGQIKATLRIQNGRVVADALGHRDADPAIPQIAFNGRPGGGLRLVPDINRQGAVGVVLARGLIGLSPWPRSERGNRAIADAKPVLSPRDGSALIEPLARLDQVKQIAALTAGEVAPNSSLGASQANAQAFACLALDGAAPPLWPIPVPVGQKVLAQGDGVPGEVLDNLGD
jgi:hypothetical protein